MDASYKPSITVKPISLSTVKYLISFILNLLSTLAQMYKPNGKVKRNIIIAINQLF